MRAPSGVLLALAAATLLGGCSGGSRPGAAGPTHAVTSSPSVVVTAHRVAAGGTARPTPGTIRQQVTTWWYGGAEGRLGWIETDLGSMNIHMTTFPDKVAGDCTSLSTDVASARSYRPVPDAQAQRHWAAALDTYQQAATDCAAGVATKNEALITKAVNDGRAASDDSNAATGRIMGIINGAV